MKELFTPVKVGAMTVPNRIVFATVDSKLGSADGEITERHIAFQSARARGGAGLLMVDNMAVEWPGGKTGVKPLRLDHDRFIAALGDLTQEVHHWGSKIVAQISHAGRQTTLSATDGQPLVSASDVAWPGSGTVPRAITTDEIDEVVERFAAAAWRARKGGCDGVEIHAAHGYLLASFLSPYTNTRDDEYGGTLDNRLRIVLRVIERARERVGADFPILVRFNGCDYMPGGMTVEEAVEIGRRLEAAGVDALSVSAGLYESGTWTFPGMPMAEGALVPLAAAIREAVSVPVVTAGKIRSPDVAESIVRDGQADLVAMARTLIADPDWPNKVRSGRADAIRPCIYCNEGCIKRISNWLRMGCNVNPDVGREGEACRVPPSGKRVLVVGGGASGLEAARRLAQRGCNVDLYEREQRLGGQLVAASRSEFKSDLRPYLTFLIDQARLAGVQTVVGTPVTPELVHRLRPDAVVVATGSQPLDRLDGHDGGLVVMSALAAFDSDAVGERVVIVGGGWTGSELAGHLAGHGHQVTLIERRAEVGGELEEGLRNCVLEILDRHNATVLTGTTFLAVEHGCATICATGDADSATKIECDTVVLATGMCSDAALSGELATDLAVFRVGDAREPGSLLGCTADAARVAEVI